MRCTINRPLFFTLATLIANTFIASTVSAGGFQLSDHSVTALGRAQAGYGIVGTDVRIGAA